MEFDKLALIVRSMNRCYQQRLLKIMQIHLQAHTKGSSCVFEFTQSTKKNQATLGWAARRLLVDGLPADLHGRWPCVGRGWLAGHPILDGCSHSHEGLLHVDGVFGTRLHEWDAHLISKRLCCLSCHNFVGSKVTLVPNKELVNIITCITVYLVQPLLHIIEAFLVCHVIYNNDSMSSAVVAASDCPEALLPSSIPLQQLQKDVNRGNKQELYHNS